MGKNSPDCTCVIQTRPARSQHNFTVRTDARALTLDLRALQGSDEVCISNESLTSPQYEWHTQACTSFALHYHTALCHSISTAQLLSSHPQVTDPLTLHVLQTCVDGFDMFSMCG